MIAKAYILNKQSKIRFHRIAEFLSKAEFKGFTSKELFIMRFIKKGWGHDIAALSNMAEALVNIAIQEHCNLPYYRNLVKKVVYIAVHPKVNPYRKDIRKVEKLGKFGYYLEHLNIILGAYRRIADDNKVIKLNKRVSEHLLKNSLSYDNYHADLLPHVRMKWPADQAAIIYSLWLYDQNNGTSLSYDLINKWTKYMKLYGTHKKTGLYKTEVLNTRRYSNQPRGCSMSYMIHYMSRFDRYQAEELWERYKEHMLKKELSYYGFREYLPNYKGRQSPDSGPILLGVGVAATGLGLNAASSINDKDVFLKIRRTLNFFGRPMNLVDRMVGPNILTQIGTDLLASSVWLNAETKIDWYG